MAAIVQTVWVRDSVYASTDVEIPLDDTIPQNTEGAELFTLAITPTSDTNILIIESNVFNAGQNDQHAIALFQDTTANALSASFQDNTGADQGIFLRIYHTMVAGTTSSTTFKIRGGEDGAGTFGFNGTTSARLFGGTTSSFIVIHEVEV